MSKKEIYYNWFDIANYLFNNIENCNNMKLQKIMFFAYIKHYENHKKELFEDNFEDWFFSPILPKLYNSFYKLLLPDNIESVIKNTTIKNTLDYIIKEYGNKNYFELSHLVYNYIIQINAINYIDDNKINTNRINIRNFLEKMKIKKEKL